MEREKTGEEGRALSGAMLETGEVVAVDIFEAELLPSPLWVGLLIGAPQHLFGGTDCPALVDAHDDSLRG